LQVAETADVKMQPKSVSAVPMGTYLGDTFRYYYIQGRTLYVLPKYLAGIVAFSVPSYPATLSGLPADRSIEQVFLETLAEVMTGRVEAAK
jgi:hypothetical protein